MRTLPSRSKVDLPEAGQRGKSKEERAKRLKRLKRLKIVKKLRRLKTDGKVFNLFNFYIHPSARDLE